MTMVISRKIDNKHHIEVETTPGVDLTSDDIEIVKTTNGQAIDLNKEPVILFRGRDKLALPMLKYYHDLCVADNCNNYQLNNLDDMIRKFEEFANNSPTMKQPGVTLGL